MTSLAVVNYKNQAGAVELREFERPSIGEELYDVQSDPNEWTNLAENPDYNGIKALLKNAGPKTFAQPGTKLNARRNLKLEGETFRWEVE